jgi:HEAT repeat protein
VRARECVIGGSTGRTRVEFARIFLALHEPGERRGQALRLARESDDLAVRIEAFHALADPEAPAIRELAVLATDPDSQLREYAFQALHRLGEAAPIEVLIKGLADPDFAARWTAADALIDMGTAALEPLLSAIATYPPSRTFHDAARRVVRRMHAPPELEAGLTALIASLNRPTSIYEAGVLAFELSRSVAGRRAQTVEA